jgi:hypothetical protein
MGVMRGVKLQATETGLYWRVFAGRIVLLSGLFLLPMAVQAGAWPYEKGRGQAIVSLETVTATAIFDEEGELTVPLDVYNQSDLSLYVQYGLTDRLTFTGKSGYQTYETTFDRFSGVPSVELGLRYTFIHTDTSVFSAAVSAEGLGQGQRSDLDITGNAGTDTELRALYGRNMRLAKYHGFLNIEAAYRQRTHGPDQHRLDATLGVKLDKGWMALAQIFAGQTVKEDYDYQGYWINTQLSLARTFGDNTLQIGWRKMVAGRHVPDKNTFIVGLWRNF